MYYYVFIIVTMAKLVYLVSPDIMVQVHEPYTYVCMFYMCFDCWCVVFMFVVLYFSSMESLVFLFKSCFCCLLDDVDVNHVDTVVGCTLWWTNIAVENHHCSWENPLFQWPLSIAMLVHQRVTGWWLMLMALVVVASVACCQCAGTGAGATHSGCLSRHGLWSGQTAAPG